MNDLILFCPLQVCLSEPDIALNTSRKALELTGCQFTIRAKGQVVARGKLCLRLNELVSWRS
jgi:hypothetical protein